MPKRKNIEWIHTITPNFFFFPRVQLKTYVFLKKYIFNLHDSAWTTNDFWLISKLGFKVPKVRFTRLKIYDYFFLNTAVIYQLSGQVTTTTTNLQTMKISTWFKGYILKKKQNKTWGTILKKKWFNETSKTNTSFPHPHT